MAIQKYIAVASLGLFVMFVAEIITIYNFMSTPPEDSFLIIEADPKIFQFISMGVAPACVMAATSFFMSKTYGSKSIGIMLIAGGAVLLVGMAIAHIMVDNIEPVFMTDIIPIVPPLFMALSFPVMIIGGRLLKTKKRRAKKEFV